MSALKKALFFCRNFTAEQGGLTQTIIICHAEDKITNNTGRLMTFLIARTHFIKKLCKDSTLTLHFNQIIQISREHQLITVFN